MALSAIQDPEGASARRAHKLQRREYYSRVRALTL